MKVSKPDSASSMVGVACECLYYNNLLPLPAVTVLPLPAVAVL